MESVVIDMCEDIVDDEELDLATRGGRLMRDPTPPEEKDLKVGKGEVEVVNGRNPGLQDMADKLAEFFESPRLCKNDYVDDFLMFFGEVNLLLHQLIIISSKNLSLTFIDSIDTPHFFRSFEMRGVR